MPVTKTILISRDPTLIKTIRESIRTIHGCQLRVFPHFSLAIADLACADSPLVIIHIQEPDDGASAARILRETPALAHSRALLAISDDHCPETALQLLRMGAVDCLSRPLDLRRLEFLLDSLTLRSRYGAQFSHPDESQLAELVPASVRDSFLCESPQMRFLVARVLKAARCDTTILFTGETGTGKTQLARVVHKASPRKSEPFIVVNCAALTESLIASELFGHVRGAFTGADNDRIGKFAAAGHGTLFMDEIDSLPLACQGKLLRVVEDLAFEQVGSNKTSKFNGRLLTASNQNLETEVAAKRFRVDLYYRLKVIEFQLPPLRERHLDIPRLAERFLKEFAKETGIKSPRITTAAMDALVNNDWPGNVRELRNSLQHAVMFCSGKTIELSDLPERLMSSASVQPMLGVSEVLPEDERRSHTERGVKLPQTHVTEVSGNDREAQPTVGDASPAPRLSLLANARMIGEIRQIVTALTEAGNNRSQAARLLGISRVALYKKLHKYELMDVKV